MALTKTSVPINFQLGLDTKVDPKQVTLGKFLRLENSVFDEIGLLKKRNGFLQLQSVSASSLSTYLGSLVALGSNLSIYSQDQELWLTKAALNEVSLSVTTLVRSSSSQSSVDASLSATGLCCEVWIDSDGNSKYQVNDSVNGQVILNAVNLPTGAKAPRSFALSTYFIITYLTAVGGNKLQYIALPINNLNSPLAPASISTLVSSNHAGYDGIVSNNVLYLAWNGSDGGGAIRFTTLSKSLIVGTPHTITGHTSDLMSVQVDSNKIWMTFWDAADNDGYTTVYDFSGNQLLAPTLVINTIVISELTTAVLNSIASIFYEVPNTPYAGVRSDFISSVTCSFAGSVSSPVVVIRSLGLASKTLIDNGVIYFLTAYQSAFQPSYFLINASGSIQAKVAYSNGGGYIVGQVLPNVSLTPDSNYFIPYLLKDLLVPVSKQNNSAIVNNFYTQTGINAVSFNLSTGPMAAEIGSNLNLTGGYLSAYDGVKPTEQGFHIWPEDITATKAQTGGMKGQIYNYQVTYEWTDAQSNLFRSAPSVPLKVDLTSTTVTPVSVSGFFSAGDTSITVGSATGLFVGQEITDATTPGNLQGGTTITSINGLVVGISLPALGTSAGDAIDSLDVGSVTLTIPTLRLTAKTGVNLVRIVVYRWSEGQQNFYQVTSVQNPVLNSTTTDTVTFTDTSNDLTILGNPLIYTTGGVVEDIGAPATQLLTLYGDRLILVDSEDQNLLWYSKQVLEATPVEMSDLFTIYIAPTIGTSGSTGPITAISVMDDKLIIFKKDAIYYITGTGPDNTGANNDFSSPVFVTATVGCNKQSSICMTPQGLMFQSSDKGIWLLGRDLNTSYIGAPVEAFNSDPVLSAITVPGTNQVRFNLGSGSMLMYDYFVGQWGTFVGIPGVSSTIYSGLHVFLNSFGSVYQENPGSYLDGSNPVLMSFTTSWIKLSGLQAYQRAYYFYLLGTFLSPHNLSVQVNYDYTTAQQQAVVIYPDNYSPPWGGDSTWGGSTLWGGNINLEQERVYFEVQKCQSTQISISEVFNPQFGTIAGEGLTISGLNLIFGQKSSYPRISAAKSTG